jgi:hypothetical protein
MSDAMCLGVGCREPAAAMPARLALGELSGTAERDELELPLCSFHQERLQRALEALRGGATPAGEAADG